MHPLDTLLLFVFFSPDLHNYSDSNMHNVFVSLCSHHVLREENGQKGWQDITFVQGFTNLSEVSVPFMTSQASNFLCILLRKGGLILYFF